MDYFYHLQRLTVDKGFKWNLISNLICENVIKIEVLFLKRFLVHSTIILFPQNVLGNNFFWDFIVILYADFYDGHFSNNEICMNFAKSKFNKD